MIDNVTPGWQQFGAVWLGYVGVASVKDGGPRPKLACHSAVRDEVHGSLPAGDVRPVWVGGTRFATIVDGRLIVSDAGRLPLRWPVLAVAEQSP